MKTIYKYVLPAVATPHDSMIVEVPLHAKFLHMAFQYGKLTIWCEVDIPHLDNGLLKLDHEKETWEFVAIGTGWEIPESETVLDYIRTVTVELSYGSELVWHIYRVLPIDKDLEDELVDILENPND